MEKTIIGEFDGFKVQAEGESLILSVPNSAGPVVLTTEQGLRFSAMIDEGLDALISAEEDRGEFRDVILGSVA